jgi:hypothetical protein
MSKDRRPVQLPGLPQSGDDYLDLKRRQEQPRLVNDFYFPVRRSTSRFGKAGSGRPAEVSKLPRRDLAWRTRQCPWSPSSPLKPGAATSASVSWNGGWKRSGWSREGTGSLGSETSVGTVEAMSVVTSLGLLVGMHVPSSGIRPCGQMAAAAVGAPNSAPAAHSAAVATESRTVRDIAVRIAPPAVAGHLKLQVREKVGRLFGPGRRACLRQCLPVRLAAPLQQQRRDHPERKYPGQHQQPVQQRA